MEDLKEKLERARSLSWQNFGKSVTFYLPGMFRYDGMTGKYPAVSITGSRCALDCDHCGGKILSPMISAESPEWLIEKCHRLEEKGNLGVLISGGCDADGKLPWAKFLSALSEIKKKTRLHVSVHSGLIDQEAAFRLKETGIDQALIDVVGDDKTLQDIYHVPFGISRILSALDSLQKAGLPTVPHIVCGLHYGKIVGEKNAIDMISRFDVEQVVIVSLMRIPGTPAWHSEAPSAEDVAEILAGARLKLPTTRISLGCARQRGNSRLDELALDAGVNRMALPSDEVIEKAESYGLNIRYQQTCCSVLEDVSKESW
jgi:lipoyl synthase